jgi:hypothetical protein
MGFNETEALSGVRLTLVKRALQRIAADHEVTASGYRKKLPRHEAINIAREVCEAVGWNYSRRVEKHDVIQSARTAGTGDRAEEQELCGVLT